MHFKTYDEYLRHWLFRAIRLTAMQRNHFTCSDCGNTATETHHQKYPKPWGTFDVPENLIPLCHDCHCKREGKKK